MSTLSFKAFLSHRYKSPDVNLYFCSLFNEIAEVQFEVDEGGGSTNVTRLERMVRDSDAFIGIYPFTGTMEEADDTEELKKQSKYFRLELDLAIRSKNPALIFYDRKYGSVVKPPGNIFSIAFDINEVTGSGGFPSYNKHKKIFENFCEVVRNKKAFDDTELNNEKTTIGLIVPQNTTEENSYSDICIEKINQILIKHNYTDIRQIKWPPILDRQLFSLFEKLDMIIVDLTEQMILSGLPAYLHGRFIPMIRLRTLCNNNDISKFNLFDNFLYGTDDCYKKDILNWHDLSAFETELENKLKRIKSKIRRIKTFDEASLYFRSAALRKEAVFLSYSGIDSDLASKISAALKERFQKVFDYKDGVSIQSGKSWIEEIHDSIQKSNLAIQLYSKSYFASGNCKHEAEQIIAQKDAGKIEVKPVKILDEGDLELPSFLESTQYKKMWKYKSINELIQSIIDELPKVE